MDCNTNNVHRQPSLELPSPKKPKMGEFVPGNNRFGSKGTIRCKKCQQRKGKCSFQHPDDACDYCFARGLNCGPKLPTPRKLAELGGFAMLTGVAIGQPLTSGALQIQIPVNASSGYNLSSANSDQETPLTSSPMYGYGPYSSRSALVSFMNPLSLGGLAMPNHTDFIVRTWSSPINNTPTQASFSNNTSPLMSSNNTSPEYSSSDTFSPEILPLDNTFPSRPSIPTRHPAHTLNASILPFVSSAIPNFQEVDAEPTTDGEEWWEVSQRLWLQLDPHPPTPRLKWNRLLHIPRCMIGRKLAGKWEDEKDSKGKSKDDPESLKSIKTAPSILC